MKHLKYRPQSTKDWSQKKERWGLQPATLSHTMGPNYKHIVWLVVGSNRRPWAVYNEGQFLQDLEGYNG